jgi:hypothetical protein
LVVQRWLAQVDERRRIDVDVIETRRDCLARERLDALDLGAGIDCILLGVDLKVIALDEYRPAEALAKRRRDRHGNVLARTLISVHDLRPRDLEDERAGIEPLRSAEDRARRVVHRASDVHRRHGKAADLAASARHVQIVDRGGTYANRLPDLPDQPPRKLALLDIPENGYADQLVHARGFQHRFVRDVGPAAAQAYVVAEDRMK